VQLCSEFTVLLHVQHGITGFIPVPHVVLCTACVFALSLGELELQNYGDTKNHFKTCKPTCFIFSFRTSELMRDSLICELETESRDDKNKDLTGGVNGFTSHDYGLHRDRVTQDTFYQI
jgi:hypothetical protein